MSLQVNKTYCPYCIYKFKNHTNYKRHLKTIIHMKNNLKKIKLFKVINNDENRGTAIKI